MSRLFGGALGLAVLTTIATAASRPSRGASAMHALTNGFALAFTVGALMTLTGAAVAALFLRPRPGANVTALPHPEEDRQPEALAA
jgi:hypothetical protein